MTILALWVSRHSMLEAQRRTLEMFCAKHGEKCVVRHISERVATADDFYRRYIEPNLPLFSRIIVVAVIPLSIVVHILNEIAERKISHRVEVWQPEMVTVAKSATEDEARNIVERIGRDKATYICWRHSSECKVLVFSRFKRIVKIDIVSENIEV